MPPTTDGATPQTLQPKLGDWLSCFWSAASCWFMAALFVTAWWRPMDLDHGSWVKYGVGLLVLEFILIHSGGFLNAFLAQKAGAERNWKLLGLTAFYALFGGAIALAFQSWWILLSFVLVMAGRLGPVFFGQSDMDRAISQRRVVAGALLFLGLTFATLFLPVPRGGLSESLLNEVWPTRKSGVWERQPERALAMGAAYFLILGLVEVRPPRKLPPPFRVVR